MAKRKIPGMEHYILDHNGNPVSTTDVELLSKFLSDGDARTVNKTSLPGDVKVSTVFLVIDHNWSGKGPPILWETMIFGGHYDLWTERYISLENAEAGHEAAVAMVRKALVGSIIEGGEESP